jgi:hypothetical protein
MDEKLLCFSLSGYPLAVERNQVEKILINKHPDRDTFVLETGVEVKSLRSYIPLPERAEAGSGNIFFLKEQKDFFGFTVDRVVGYLTLTGTEKIQQRKERSPIKYFVRNEGRLIPVLDLQFITNNANSIANEDIAEITNVSIGSEDVVEGEEVVEEVFQELSEEEVYKSIEEELQKRKREHRWDMLIRSEKKGLVLPLIVNLVIIGIVSMGLVYYLVINRGMVREQSVEDRISGVEEELIREIRRRSEAEIAEQKRKLEDARKRLEALQNEREFFLSNQDTLLEEREKELRESLQLQLEESRKRIASSGVSNVDSALEEERERLYAEYLAMRDVVREELEKERQRFEENLSRREAGIKQEVNQYTQKISEVEQQLREEQAKLKEAEQKVQNIEVQQQEYRTFRRQINTIYNEALGYFARGDYSRGISQLETILPVIQSAKEKGIGEPFEMDVEENLVKNVLYLAEREQNRSGLDQIGKKTFEAALVLEQEGKNEEALSRYYTVYTVTADDRYKRTALERAENIMDKIYSDRSMRETKQLEKQADALFNQAMAYKNRGEYGNALGSLEEIITKIGVPSRSKSTLDEIKKINDLLARKKETEELTRLDQKAAVVMREARRSYNDGYFADALDKYEDVVRNYRNTQSSETALSEIIRINEEMRGMKATPPRYFKTGETDSGVIIQALPGGTILFNLGSDQEVAVGDTLQVYRNEHDQFTFIGSVKVFDVYPRLSKGKVAYSEKAFKIGDVIAY